MPLLYTEIEISADYDVFSCKPRHDLLFLLFRSDRHLSRFVESKYPETSLDSLTFELVMLTTRFSAILVVNKRTDTRFDQTPVKNFVVVKSRIRSRSAWYSLSNQNVCID